MGQVTSQPALRIVRTIPNTPVKVRRGSVAVTFSEGCSGQDKEVVNTIFSRWVHTAVHCLRHLYFTVCVQCGPVLRAAGATSELVRCHGRVRSRLHLPGEVTQARGLLLSRVTCHVQVIEALADGGVMMGLPRDLAQEHAAAMVEGAAGMVLSQAKHPGQLKDEVCSPGGSTIRGVDMMERGGVRAALMAAVRAAAERNEELGKK